MPHSTIFLVICHKVDLISLEGRGIFLRLYFKLSTKKHDDLSDMRNIIFEWTRNVDFKDCYRLSFFRCRDVLVRGPRNTPISSKHFGFEKLGCHLMHCSFVIGNFTQNLAKSLLPLFKHLWRGTSICGFFIELL